MERIWLKHYPAGVPADIDVTQYSSLVELLEESFKKFADRKAFICMDKAITYRELDEMSSALGAYLQSKGLQKGARVALMMPNVLQYPVATAAVLRAGFAVVNVNPLYTPRELEHQLKDSGAEAIIVLENFATTVQKVLPNTAVKHVIVGSMGDLLGLKGVIVNLVVRRVKKMVPAWSIPGAVSFNEALSAGRGMKLNKPVLTRQDVAFLQYTGGTTGVSKGATLIHQNVLANVLQNDAWLQPALKKPPHVEQLLIVCALPLYHIFALTACYLLAVRADAARYPYHFGDTLTVPPTRRGAALAHRMLHAVRARTHVLFTSAQLNTPRDVYANLLEGAVVAAAKLHAYARALRPHRLRTAVVCDAVHLAVRTAYPMVVSRLRLVPGERTTVTRAAVEWVGYVGFYAVLGARPTYAGAAHALAEAAR